MSLKERTHDQIEKEELKDQALNVLITCADSILVRSPFYEAGEYYKKDRRYKGECFQRLIKEMCKTYDKKCQIPEVRFMIWENNNCVLNVFDKDRLDSKGKLKVESQW
jgi:hypothetical protein